MLSRETTPVYIIVCAGVTEHPGFHDDPILPRAEHVLCFQPRRCTEKLMITVRLAPQSPLQSPRHRLTQPSRPVPLIVKACSVTLRCDRHRNIRKPYAGAHPDTE